MSTKTRLGDFIRVSVRTTKSVSFILSVRVDDKSKDGDKERGLRYFDIPFSVSTIDASEVVQNIVGLSEGELLAVNLKLTTTGVQRGETFVEVSISNQNHPTIASATLFADYLTSGTHLSYPGSAVSNPLNGIGALKSNIVIDSGTMSFVVPANLQYKIKSIYLDGVVPAGESLIAGIGVIYMDDSSGIIFVRNKTNLYVGGASVSFTGFVNASQEAMNGNNNATCELFSIPDLICRAGYSFSIGAIGISDYPRIVCNYEQLITP